MLKAHGVVVSSESTSLTFGWALPNGSMTLAHNEFSYGKLVAFITPTRQSQYFLPKLLYFKNSLLAWQMPI